MSGRAVRQRRQTETRRPIIMATFLAAGLLAASGCLFAASASAQEPSVAAPTLAEEVELAEAAGDSRVEAYRRKLAEVRKELGGR